MTDDPINLNEHRAFQADDNVLWTPRDCVAAFLRNMDAGKEKPTRLLIIYEEEQPNGDTKLLAYRANVTRHQEIAMLSVKLHITIQDWVR